MAKFIWLLSLTLVVANMVVTSTADVNTMVHPMLSPNEEPIQQPIQLGRIGENPNANAVAPPIPALEVAKPEGIEENLPPISPIFPSFFQSGNEFFDNAAAVDSIGSDRKRGGILTILVIKSKKPTANDESSDSLPTDESKKILEENLSKINQFKSQVSESFSKLAGLIRNDLFGGSQPQLIGGGSEDVDRKRLQQHLLGGSNDIDSAVFKQQQQVEEQEEEDDEEQEQNESSSKFQSILSWFRSHNEPLLSLNSNNNDESNNDLPQLIIRTNSDEIATEKQQQMLNDQQKKKCMMYSFMRLKASIYYRTIVHLLFITGIMLIIFFMAILSVRVYKRRQSLRYYSSNNMKISTIDQTVAALSPGDTEKNKEFLFRSSSLKSSYAQKIADQPAPPPAYSALPQTLPTTEDDEKKSLPDYEATK